MELCCCVVCQCMTMVDVASACMPTLYEGDARTCRSVGRGEGASPRATHSDTVILHTNTHKKMCQKVGGAVDINTAPAVAAAVARKDSSDTQIQPASPTLPPRKQVPSSGSTVLRPLAKLESLQPSGHPRVQRKLQWASRSDTGGSTRRC